MEKKWEYRVTLVHLNASDGVLLNPMGADGWELVTIIVETQAYRGVAYLKREKPSEIS